MENRHKTMNVGKYGFGFAVDWMRKDLDIVLSEARRNKAKLPMTGPRGPILRRRPGDGRQLLGHVVAAGARWIEVKKKRRKAACPKDDSFIERRLSENDAQSSLDFAFSSIM